MLGKQSKKRFQFTQAGEQSNTLKEKKDSKEKEGGHFPRAGLREKELGGGGKHD